MHVVLDVCCVARPLGLEGLVVAGVGPGVDWMVKVCLNLLTVGGLANYGKASSHNI